jgi:CheY-like chemotaxis protein
MNRISTLDALFPGARRLLVCALFGEPGRLWSLSELVGRTGLKPESLRRLIATLSAGGLVETREERGRVWYQSNRECPIHAEIESIVARLTERSAGGETILVVEDQPATARITRILLESWGYVALEAHDGAEALDLYDGRDGEIHLVLTDVLMPGMSGPELAAELLRRRPALPVILMSGYPNQAPGGAGGCAFLPKPFNPASLASTVRRELDRAARRK